MFADLARDAASPPLPAPPAGEAKPAAASYLAKAQRAAAGLQDPDTSAPDTGAGGSPNQGFYGHAGMGRLRSDLGGLVSIYGQDAVHAYFGGSNPSLPVPPVPTAGRAQSSLSPSDQLLQAGHDAGDILEVRLGARAAAAGPSGGELGTTQSQARTVSHPT